MSQQVGIALFKAAAKATTGPTTVYKQIIRTALDYTSMTCAADLAQTYITTLQRTPNKALRIITGSTNTTPNQHIHRGD